MKRDEDMRKKRSTIQLKHQVYRYKTARNWPLEKVRSFENQYPKEIVSQWSQLMNLFSQLQFGNGEFIGVDKIF